MSGTAGRPITPAGFLAYTTRLLPSTGLRARSGQRVARGALHDVPLQDLPIGRHRPVVVVGRAHRAAQPPVRRVQRVGAVRRRRGRSPAPAHAGPAASAAAVDADVAALHERRVVLVGELPADLLGQPRRHGDRHGAAGPQDAGQLVERGLVVGDVLEHLGGDDAVEGAVGERAAGCRRPARRRPATSGRDLAGLGHRPEGVAHLLQLGVGVVEGDDPGAALGRLVGVAAEAAARGRAGGRPGARRAARSGR